MPPKTAYHDELGDLFAEHADTSPYNAWIDRPALLDLAGEVTGRRILDAGCGAGHHAAGFLARGAEVVGVDGSATLLRHARARLGEGVELRLHDLEQPLDFLGDASFDDVVCALMIHHLTHRREPLAELFRVLRPGGRLLLSTTHPTADWLHFGGSYHSSEWVDLDLGGSGASIHYQRMTLEATFDEVLGTGFRLDKPVEPRPLPELREIDRERHEKLRTTPAFLALRLVKPEG
ncbi:methyltransferase domain-containing protein [Streptomyces alkaliphilus]|uniref:Methyltransferase domain-containing protein n=1 Tax=Streptomyces alkaliphilus TaxID=1472722 RepID=A0A7W3Y0C4_9ACTN|nr:class I SAM-dependent methyltransferase [Streptomyces alkaliphilus]MBB0243100.1 methyltransferase domain-containing protein [Streptomyces alkaliphilus]